MVEGASPKTMTEAVANFEDAVTLQGAIDELQSSGFDRAELSLLASETAVEEKLGRHYEKLRELEDDPSVPRAAYVSTESLGDAEGGLIGTLVNRRPRTKLERIKRLCSDESSLATSDEKSDT